MVRLGGGASVALPDAVLVLCGGGGWRLDRDTGDGGAVDAPSDSSRTRGGAGGALVGSLRSGVGGTALVGVDIDILLGLGGGGGGGARVDGPDLDNPTRGGNGGAAFIVGGGSLRVGVEGDGREGILGGLAAREGWGGRGGNMVGGLAVRAGGGL